MISCTEFIPAYSEFFAFLERRGGKPEVHAFWDFLSDHFLTNLRDLVAQKGLAGCYDYWSHTLNEEAADFVMTLDEEAGVFSIEMNGCPSKGLLLKLGHYPYYPDYCAHCDRLYRRVLEPLGYQYEFDMSQTDQARCRLAVRRPSPLPQDGEAPESRR
jgi:hypothetical protein